ncbi:hypothetical protein O181_017123 [Austropuccinia psidii MF-1]|uniref:Uncharacterized protein n=1 Tax=Austropuccinia psidii MF-1 TaxID=1389203 RepID=A0A9Q3C5L4_9BASI|nr:hypothetical protein [Austropuccinia psidii MF-1]
MELRVILYPVCFSAPQPYSSPLDSVRLISFSVAAEANLQPVMRLFSQSDPALSSDTVAADLVAATARKFKCGDGVRHNSTMAEHLRQDECHPTSVLGCSTNQRMHCPLSPPRTSLPSWL